MRRAADLTGAELLVLVGGVLAAVGAFLPWATATTGFGTLSIGGMDVQGSDAVIVLILGVATAIPGAWLPWRTAGGPVVDVLSGGILVALAYFEANALHPTGSATTVTAGAGLWVVGIGGTLAVLGGLGRWRLTGFGNGKRVVLGIGVVALLAGALYVGALWSAGQEAQTLSKVEALLSQPPSSTHTFSGTTDLNTAPFDLTAGDYQSHWTKGSACELRAQLNPIDTSDYHRWNLGGSNSDGPPSGTAIAFGVPAGRFYISVSGSCAWRFELTRE